MITGRYKKIPVRNPTSQSANVEVIQRSDGFTLIELLAVMLVIALLSAMALAVAGYARKRMGVGPTTAQLVAIQAALDAYKSDFGYYPASTITNVSANGTAEAVNNGILYQALNGNGRHYLSATQNVRTNSGCSCVNIFDAFGVPFNYYNSPATPLFIYQPAATTPNNGYFAGGQVNTSSYDLRSYGPDTVTWPPSPYTLNPPSPNSGNASWLTPWQNSKAALDDITNWGR